MNRIVLAVSFAIGSLPAMAYAQQPAEEKAPSPPAEAAPQQPSEPPPAYVYAKAAQEDTSLAERREPEREGPPRFDFIRVNAGLKIGYVDDRGYDAFSTNDVLPAFALDGTYPLLTSGKLVLAAGLAWEAGAQKADTRGMTHRLMTHRFGIPIEARYHVGTGAFLFGKVSPGVRAILVDVEDPSAPTTLSDTAWAFGADLSAGASILLGPRARPDKKQARVWFTPELGYAFAQSATLRPSPQRDADDVLGTDASTNLRSLALGGFFWRASIGLTY